MNHSVWRRWRQWAGALGLSALLLATGSVAMAANTVETAVRLVVTDGGSGELTVIDPADGDVTGQFTTPIGGFAPVYPSSTGRYVLVNHFEGDQVTIIDAGLSLAEHGDHVDLVTAPPFILATLTTGEAPAHFWAHDGLIAIHNDGEGTVTLLAEATLADGVKPVTFAVAQPDHSSVAILGDAVLVGYYDLGRVDAYGLDGALLAENLGACAGTHGEAKIADTIVFACADGLLLVTRAAGEFSSQKVAYPGTTGETGATPVAGETPRIGTLAAPHDAGVLVGDFGQGLALITVNGEDVAFTELALPANALSFSYDQAGEQVVVLTDDGSLHGVEPVAGALLWSTPAVTPYSAIAVDEGFALYPSLAVSDSAAYAADPATGEVVEVNLATGEVSNRFEIGGQPARVTLVLAKGVDH